MRPLLVLVTTSFPLAGDGSEAAGSFVADLVTELAKHVRVRVVAPGRGDGRDLWIGDVEVFRYAAPPHALSTLKPWVPADMRWIARVLRGGLQATRAAAGGEATHIFALWGLPCGEWARRVAKERGIGYSVWLLGSDVWSLGRIPLVRGALARVIRRARYAYADGYQLAADGELIGGVPVTFLPSTRSIGLADPPPPRDKPPYRLLFLGRWHPNKGIDLLLDTLAQLGEADWQRIERVEIQGGGPLEPLVRERVGALRTAGRPVEAGRYLTKAEAEAAMARADWVAIPSRIESIPVVFSDAMKLGRPVIATAVGDLPMLIAKGHCGILASRAEVPSLRTALHEALNTPPSALAHDVANEAGQFDLPTIASRLSREMLGYG